MHISLSFGQAVSLLLKDDYAKWTVDGAEALVKYYELLEEETGEEINFDPVAIRCDWAEYKTLEDIAEAYSIKGLELATESDERENLIRDWVLSDGELIDHPSGYLVKLI
jgi:hypothetical protein